MHVGELDTRPRCGGLHDTSSAKRASDGRRINALRWRGEESAMNHHGATGQVVQGGQRYGMIKMGSKVDLYLPDSIMP